MTAQDFLPQGYELPKTRWEFMKLQQGENKIRILQSPSVWRIDWDQTWEKKKPIRTKTKQDALSPLDDKNQPKHFWGLKVYDYTTSSVSILEITQGGILTDIMTYVKEPEYWNPTWYDIKITKTWSGKDTKYATVAMPPKDMTKEIVAADKATPVNLEALFTGWNPFEVATDEDLPFN